jgi:hypothetical protein
VTETIKVRKKSGKKTKTVTETVARATVHLASGARKTAKLSLDTAGRTALKKAKRLSVTITVSALGKTVKKTTVTLKATTKKAKKKK